MKKTWNQHAFFAQTTHCVFFVAKKQQKKTTKETTKQVRARTASSSWHRSCCCHDEDTVGSQLRRRRTMIYRWPAGTGGSGSVTLAGEDRRSKQPREAQNPRQMLFCSVYPHITSLFQKIHRSPSNPNL